MRFERDLVHPAIFAASDQLVSAMWTSGWPSGSKEQAKAFSEHQRLWWKEYGLGCGALIVGFMGSLAGIAALKPMLGREITGPLALAVMLGWALVTYLAYRRNMRQLTVGELKVLLPALDLTPIQRVYAEALVTVAELKLPDDQYREVVGQLNRLLDEEQRLLALRDQGVASPATRSEIEAERERIEDRLAATQDPITRQALERSREIAQNRLHAAHELSLVGERVDAQLEMVDQAIRSIRDSLRRLRAAPTSSLPAIDLDAVRQSVDIAHDQTRALELAVEEVRTLA